MTFAKRLALGLSSAGGLGYAPSAPGTFGSLAGLPLWWLVSGLDLWVQALAVLAVAVVSVPIASRAEQIYGGHDNQRIVIDEVAGMMVTAFAVPFTWVNACLVFVAFRFFDILKPPPVRWLDARVSGGFGVVVDDLAAGVYAALVVQGVLLLVGSG